MSNESAGPWNDYAPGGPWEDYAPTSQAAPAATEAQPAAQAPVQLATPSQPPSMMQQVAQSALLSALSGQQSAQPLSMTGSNPATQGLTAAVESLQNPGRIEATYQKNANAAGDLLTNKLKSNGVGPMPSKAAGFVASMLLDPGTFAMGPAGEMGGTAAETVAKGIGKNVLAPAANVLTGVAKRDVAALASDPMKILFSKGLKQAGKDFGEAKLAAGVTEGEERLIAKAGDRAAGTARTVADAMREKVDQGAELTVGEILAGKRAASKIAMTGKGSERAIYAKDANLFDQLLKQQAPEVAKAQADVALAKTRQTFMNVFPQNKSGGESALRGLIELFSAAHNPAYALAMSPIGAGMGATAAGLGYKAAAKVVGNPVVRTGLAAAFKNHLMNQ